MRKTISLDLPYPSIKGVTADRRTVMMVRRAYAGKHGELKGVLQYVYHYFYFNKLKDFETANVILGIAQCEMKHFEILGELLLELGIDPIFSSVSPLGASCDFVSDISYSKTAEKMIFDDISFEMVSASNYERLSDEVEDPTLQALFKRLALDEELHIKVLRNRLNATK